MNLQQPRKHTFLKFIVTIFCIIIAFTIISNLNEKPKENNTTKKTAKNKTSSKNNFKKKSNKKKLDLVKSGKFKKISDALSIKVNKTVKKDKIVHTDGYLVSKPNEDNSTWIVVNLTVKNTGTSSENFNFANFNLSYKDGSDYVPSTIFTDSDFLTYETINPKMKQSGNLVFSVPKKYSISKFRLKYINSLFSDDIYFKLK